MQRVIGIDFGTSTTYMSVKRYNGSQPDGDKFSYMPVMFNYGESSGYVASIVRENARGIRRCGVLPHLSVWFAVKLPKSA